MGFWTRVPEAVAFARLFSAATATGLEKRDRNVRNTGALPPASSARGPERLLPLWLRVMRAMRSPMLQFKIAR